MGMIRFNFRSEELGRYVDVSIAMPTDDYTYRDTVKSDHMGKKPLAQYRPGMKLQTVYLLHGGGDDDSLTYRYTNAERYAQRNNVMLVTPDISNSFGIDTAYGVNYQSFVAKELPTVVQSLFASSPERDDNFIIGYAMGGNAALGTALAYPGQYRMCIDMSGGIGLTLSTDTLKKELEGDHFRKNMRIYNSSFGEASDIEGSAYDLYERAKRNITDKTEVPELIVCCGSREFIRERVEEDVRLLKELGYPVRYICPEGYDHDFDMWDTHLRLALDEWLPLKRFTA